MKKFWKRIISFYRTHTFAKLVLTVLIISAAAAGIRYIPVLGVSKNALPEVFAGSRAAASEELGKDAGEVLAAGSGSKELYIDTKTMNLRVTDTKSGQEWNALVPNAQGAPEQSLISLTALGDDNNLYEYTSYEYCTALSSYRIFRIENGVRIEMTIGEGESVNFFEYYPLKMPVDRYENFFLKGLEEKAASGDLDEAKAAKYIQTLGLIYRKNTAENCYSVANNGTPPASAAKQLIEAARLLNYTTEMLLEDSEAFGLTVTFKEPASFFLILEAVLENGEFVVRVPADQMKSANDFYTIQNVKVMPNFGASPADAGDGYILVPDGAGALFEFNTYSAAVPDYIRPVYDNDFYTDYYFMPEYGQELTMPIFGMTYGKDEKATHGFLTVIENGAHTAYVNTKLAGTGKESGSAYNKAYASFDVTQYTKVKVYGPYSEQAATYLSETEPVRAEFTLRYLLFSENVTYYKMAAAYREYLKERWGTDGIQPEKPGLYLDFIGTLTLKKHFLGIPYDSEYSMTTYEELLSVLKAERSKNPVAEYSGFFNGGLANRLMNRADPTGANGDREEWMRLDEYVKSEGLKLYYEAPISGVWDSGNGFYPKLHAVHDYSDRPAQLYRYFEPLGILDGYAYESDNTMFRYNLSPFYLKGIADKFLQDADDYDGLAIPDLANAVFTDYKYNRQAGPYEAAAAAEETLSLLASKKDLTLKNPNMDLVRYGGIATDISRKSSEYKTFYTTIPFRQLVLNGLTACTTKDVNMSSESADYYILQAVELGVTPKFTLTAGSVDVLKDGPYSWLYSTEYETLKETIDRVYGAVEAAFDVIGTARISNHTILGENVFCTEYENGARVITNYNLTEAEADGQKIGALSYVLTAGK